MANRFTTVWLWRPTPTDPLAKLGFYKVLKTAAQALIDGGYAQWPRIGAYRFNFRDKNATTIALSMSASPASVEEGEVATYTIRLANAISAPVLINLARDASSTAVAGTDYTNFPAQITIPPDNEEFELQVQTLAGSGGKALRINASAVHPSITGTPNATVTITAPVPPP